VGYTGIERDCNHIDLTLERNFWLKIRNSVFAKGVRDRGGGKVGILTTLGIWSEFNQKKGACCPKAERVGKMKSVSSDIPRPKFREHKER